MANMDLHEPKQSTNTPPPSIQTPLMSPMPLQLSGFLSGDTIQVQGDAGDLKFSVQLNITKNLFHDKVGPLDSPKRVAHNPEKVSFEDSSFASYGTPIGSGEPKDQSCFAEAVEDEDSYCCFGEEGDEYEKMKIGECLVTRLRSGVISPVTYYPPKILTGKLRSCERVKPRRKSSEQIDVFERLLRRHSCPVKPCTSYAFFVMATWGVVKSSSFGETSKRLGQMWYKLSHKEKKV